jgi:NTP pyrophosphatase (non-canonical NTP hydrolase)
MTTPTIDTDLQQVKEEIAELRLRLFQYLTLREKQRYEALMHRMHQLSRVIENRNQEHMEKA